MPMCLMTRLLLVGFGGDPRVSALTGPALTGRVAAVASVVVVATVQRLRGTVDGCAIKALTEDTARRRVSP